MFSDSGFFFHVVCALTGLTSFLQQVNGDEVTSNLTGATSGRTFFLYKRLRYPRDCSEVLDHCSGRDPSGVFVIKPDGYPNPFEVYCNNSFESGGWTVFMRRGGLNGSLVFARNWGEYKKGFGFLSNEFWLGNEKLAFLTNQLKYELRIDVTVSNGSMAFLTYDSFRVEDEWNNYALTSLGNAKGNTDFLAPICPNNTIYTTCTCEKTCEAPTFCQSNCQRAKRCVCPDGFFLRGSDCVPPEECQCYSATAGKVIPVGQSYTNNQCSEQCSCSRSSFSCSNYRCDSRALCSSTGEGGHCVCRAGFVGNGLVCRCTAGLLADGSRCRLPRDCDEVASIEGYSGSGLYNILPSNWQEFQVYCNMSGGRWTVLQRRIPGSRRSFWISWDSYKVGFGELQHDFWLGNDNIHYLTNQRRYELRIDIIDSANKHFRALYDMFRIGNEESKYRMTVLGSYSGNAGYDAMRGHLNQAFTTWDQDNDNWDGSECYIRYYNDTCWNAGNTHFHNCAFLHEGAWWYKNRGSASTSSGACDRSISYSYCNDVQCYYKTCCEDDSCNNCGSYAYSCAFSNLNGRESGPKGKSIIWHGLNGNDCGIKFTEMKIRPL